MEKNRSILELYAKNVSIIGCGHYGQACARLFHAFGCTLTGVTRTYRKLPEFFEKNVLTEDLHTILPISDIVILALPGDRKNTHFMDKERILSMKSNSVLVNMARGNLVDANALTDSLLSGKLLGAVLDVFEEEPLPIKSPLWTLNNVILTPHNSFVGEGNDNRLSEVIFDNLHFV